MDLSFPAFAFYTFFFGYFSMDTAKRREGRKKKKSAQIIRAQLHQQKQQVHFANVTRTSFTLVPDTRGYW